MILLRTWRRSITLRVVSATLVLSLTVLALLGQLVMRGVRDGLVDSKVSASRAQAAAGFASAQSRLEAAGTPQRANVGQLLTQIVTARLTGLNHSRSICPSPLKSSEPTSFQFVSSASGSVH